MMARLFGNTPEFWLNIRNARDIWDSAQQYRSELEQIHPLDVA